MEDELPKDLGRRIGDMSDLPDELRSQLQVAKTSELESGIMAIIGEVYGGVANVDEIMVGLYRKTGVIHQRQQLANKLYRMGAVGMLENVPKKKGVYRIK